MGIEKCQKIKGKSMFEIKPNDQKKARAAGARTCGRRHQVGDKRMNEREISELLDIGQGNVCTALQKELADHYVKRMLNKKHQ